CDTMKKARAWLDKAGIDYSFHDYKTAGIDKARLERWSQAAGWETLLNRSGTTFRKLPEADKEGLTAAKAINPLRNRFAQFSLMFSTSIRSAKSALKRFVKTAWGNPYKPPLSPF
ncbi:MAG: hypothetical protein Q6M04_11975, partial [Thermostichus sp. BF3_bins_97]